MTTISEQVNEIRAMRSPRPDGEPPNPFEFEQVRPAAAGVPEGALHDALRACQDHRRPRGSVSERPKPTLPLLAAVRVSAVRPWISRARVLLLWSSPGLGNSQRPPLWKMSGGGALTITSARRGEVGTSLTRQRLRVANKGRFRIVGLPVARGPGQ
jgi:hypothetical protein